MKMFIRDYPTERPIIVAEISGSHLGSLERAFGLIAAAKKAGADAVKCQAYEPRHITIKSTRPEFVVKNPLWKGRTLWDLYEEAHTPLSWLEPMFRYAGRMEIPVFASVFDLEGLAELERLNAPVHKVASFEITDIPLLEAIAATGKPAIISTGMASPEEIQDALATMSHNEVFLLQAVSGYPTPISEANLPRMTWLKRWCNCHIGISDHTLGSTVPIAATALGAKLIEKHMCLSREDGGPDAAFSMEPHEFQEMANAVRDAWAAIQSSPSPSEDVNRQLRRSLYVMKDVAKGEPFTTKNVRSIRPANGLPPRRLYEVLGRTASMNIQAGTPLSEEMLQP